MTTIYVGTWERTQDGTLVEPYNLVWQIVEGGIDYRFGEADYPYLNLHIYGKVGDGFEIIKTFQPGEWDYVEVR